MLTPIAEARPCRPFAAGFPPLAVCLLALAAACSSGSSAGPSGPITANARPEFTSISPAATEVQLEAGDLLAFEVAAADPDGSPVTVEFLVDGVRAELASRYDFQAGTEGTHEIAVRVSDGIHTVTHLWTVRVTPDVQLPPAVSVGVTPDSGIAPLEVAVQVTGQDEDGTIVRWELDADGDGRYEVVDDEPPALTARLDEAGTVRVRARVTDDEGLVGLAEQLVHVTENAPPRAALSLSPDQGLAPLEVHVRAEGHDPEGALVLHELDVDGDGVFDLAQTAPFDIVLVFDDYSAPVRVTLRVTDAAGHTDEAVHDVRARPDVDAGRSRVLQGATDRLLADGRAARALTVQLVDRAGRPLPGVEVELASSRNAAGGVVDRISPARASTDGRGELHATLTTTSSSTLMGDATVTARAADVELAESVLVQFFSAVSAIATTISCPATAVHVASSTAEPRGARVTANVRDGAGRPLADVFVELRTRDGALWPVAPASGRSDGAGRFGGTVTSEVPNDNTFVDVYADGLKTSAICVVSFLP